MARVEINEAVFKNVGSLAPAPGVSVQVNVRAGAATTVYQAATGSSTFSNPLSTDASGRIEGWLEEGSYDLVVSGPGISTYTQRLEAVSSATTDPAGDPPSAVLRTETPFVTGRMRLRDRWSAGDFGAKFAGDDETTELQSAVHETRAVGRVLYLPEGTTGVSARLTDVADDPSSLFLKGAGKRATTIEYTGDVASMVHTLGSIEAVATLTATADRGDVALTVDDSAGLAAGDLLMIRDQSQVIYGNTTKEQVACPGNVRKIRSVDSATQITLWGPLSYDYAIDSDIRRINTIKGASLRDFTVVNPVPGTLSGLSGIVSLIYTEKIDIDGIGLRDMDASGIRLQTCWDWRAADISFDEFRDYEQTNAPYCLIATNGTSWGKLVDSSMHYGRHMFTTGPGSTVIESPVQDILIADCIATGQSEAAFDTHPGAARIHFHGCHVYGGDDEAYQIRGPDCTITDPVIDAATVGILAVNGADNLRVSGGRSSNCATGIEIANSNGVRVSNHEIDRPITTGVLVREEVGWSAHVQKLRLADVEVLGDPSGAAFDFSDKWMDAFELDNVRAPDATTKISGADTTPTLYGRFNDGFAGGVAPSTASGSSLSLTLVANQANLSRFVPQRNMVVSTLVLTVTTLASADDAIDVGIYSMRAAGGLARLVSKGATTGLVNSTGRKTISITATKLVAGTVYYVAISCGTLGGTAAVVQAAGFNNADANKLMGTTAPNALALSKATSHPLPDPLTSLSASVVSGPKMGVLE